MAAATATSGCATSAFTFASSISPCNSNSWKQKNKVSVRSLKLYGGLKPETKVMNLGVPLNTEQQFAKLVTVCNALKGKPRGGAATSTCNHVTDEIFTVVPIMSVLVLIGVAIGFVLLRVEAALEEAE
eukprot:Gb_00822 [translate_table: standard]